MGESVGRAIGGAVVGYLVLFVTIFALMSATWFALGAAGAFEPGVWNLSATWIATALAVAAFGGWLAGKVPQGALPRPDQLPMFEAMGHAVAPPWTAIVQPLLNAAFALLASRRKA